MLPGSDFYKMHRIFKNRYLIGDPKGRERPLALIKHPTTLRSKLNEIKTKMIPTPEKLLLITDNYLMHPVSVSWTRPVAQPSATRAKACW